jgi:hypothetical protein
MNDTSSKHVFENLIYSFGLAISLIVILAIVPKSVLRTECRDKK